MEILLLNLFMKIYINDNELCAVITDNGQDASIGVLFDTLYDKI